MSDFVNSVPSGNFKAVKISCFSTGSGMSTLSCIGVVPNNALALSTGTTRLVLSLDASALSSGGVAESGTSSASLFEFVSSGTSLVTTSVADGTVTGSDVAFFVAVLEPLVAVLFTSFTDISSSAKTVEVVSNIGVLKDRIIKLDKLFLIIVLKTCLFFILFPHTFLNILLY
ncbi:hypothetical protein RU86_GL000416 [Lactococcus piscium]|uniref:Uncharacterized protein n=1 Tax=Pseudolactococcus piscium TaxID=1364 RepID=A0A2A5RYB2_9LACT|nr:hypothetical protein RU86_GL000416 [Lactococcus piscium]